MRNDLISGAMLLACIMPVGDCVPIRALPLYQVPPDVDNGRQTSSICVTAQPGCTTWAARRAALGSAYTKRWTRR